MNALSALPLSISKAAKVNDRPHRALTLAAATVGLAGVAALLIVRAVGMQFEASPFLSFVALAAAMVGVAVWCTKRGLDSRMADAAVFVALGSMALMTCGIISNAGLRFGLPPIDGWLASADALAGIHVDQAVRAFARQGWLISALSFAYAASGIIVVLLLFGALAARRRALAWELLVTLVLTMQVVAMVSIAFPAIGAMTYFDLAGLQGHGLPPGSGTYHLKAFAHFHAGPDDILRVADISGLVTFPSFHTVLALIATQALAATRIRWIAVAWTATVIVSTIPIGGHYAVDVVAGAAIWAVCVGIAKKVSNPSA